MPGTVHPSGGLQGFVAQFQALATRIANLEARQRQTRAVAPGTITQWGGATAPPGALLCNGATFSASQYPALYAALGTTTLPTVTTTPITVIWT